MDKQQQLIPDVTNMSKNWKVRVTISEEISVMRCSTGARLKRYILSDIEGNEIVGSIYDPDLDILDPMLHLYAVYDISNAEVKHVSPKYRILPNTFQWVIRKTTLIEPVADARPYLKYILKDIIPLIDLPDAAKQHRITADVMGIVIDNDEPKRVNSDKNEVQHFTILDPDMFPVRISLWDESIATHGFALENAVRNNSVLIAKRVALRAYDSISLSIRNSSSIAIDPPIETVTEFKAWFRSIPSEELENLKVRKTTAFTKDLISIGKMTTHEPGGYWIRGYLRLIDEDQQLYYIACSSCKRKVSADLEHKYRCFICKSQALAIVRLFVILTVMDRSGDMEVAATDETAGKILQTTTEDLKNLIKAGQKLEIESIKAELYSKRFLMLLIKTPTNNNRLLLQSFYDEGVPAIPQASDSSSKMLVGLPLSPLKRQLSGISINTETSTKKKLTFIEGPQYGKDDESSSSHH